MFRQAFSPVLNDSGAIAFLGDLTPPPAVDEVIGVYLHRRGVTIAVARPGDEMPGGGHFVTSASISGWQIDVNNAGEVVFNATLNTDGEGDEFPDTGLYLFSHGKLRLVARTGTEIPGSRVGHNCPAGDERALGPSPTHRLLSQLRSEQQRPRTSGVRRDAHRRARCAAPRHAALTEGVGSYG